MAIYKASELLNQISEIINDGYSYIDIIELEGDDCDDDTDNCDDNEIIPTSLSFQAIGDFAGIDNGLFDDGFFDYGSIDSCDYSDDDDSELDLNSTAPITFNYQEVLVLKQSIDNALVHLKACSEIENCPKDTLDHIKTSSIAMRNLQAKLKKFINSVKV